MNIDERYPECFPENIEELIKADGAGENIITYYRISRTGLINRDAFIGTYEESLSANGPGHNRDIQMDESLDIGDYSTSGYEKLREIRKFYKCMKKYADGPVIMAGHTIPSCGLSMRTRDSKTRQCKNSHVDWWIYRNAHPEIYFKKVT